MTVTAPPRSEHPDQGPGDGHRSESVKRNTFFGLADADDDGGLHGRPHPLPGAGARPRTTTGSSRSRSGVGTILVLVADFGISGSSGRFIAEERGDRRRVAAVVSDSTWLKLAVLVPVCGGLLAARRPDRGRLQRPGPRLAAARHVDRGARPEHVHPLPERVRLDRAGVAHLADDAVRERVRGRRVARARARSARAPPAPPSAAAIGYLVGTAVRRAR